MARDVEPGRTGCSVGIGPRRIGHDRNADRVRIGRRRCRIAPRGFNPPIDPTEQIDLIGDTQAAIDRPVLGLHARQTLDFRHAAIIGTGGNIGLRKTIRLSTAQRCPSLFEPRHGDTHIRVRRQRILDEPIEDGIIIEAPPVGCDRLGQEGRAGRGEEGAGGRLGGNGSDVVRPRRAGRQGQRGNVGRSKRERVMAANPIPPAAAQARQSRPADGGAGPDGRPARG